MTTFEQPVTIENLSKNIQYVKKVYESAEEYMIRYNKVENDTYNQCFQQSQEILYFIEKMNRFQINRIPEDIKTIFLISAAVLMKTFNLSLSTRSALTDDEKNTLKTCLVYLERVLQIEPFHEKARELFKIIIVYLVNFNTDNYENIVTIEKLLAVHPCDYQTQYITGFLYSKINDVQKTLQYLYMAIGIIDIELKITSDSKTEFKVKSLANISEIYYASQENEVAKYYLTLALKTLPDDPDIHNMLGTIYNSIGKFDKAIEHYKNGIR